MTLYITFRPCKKFDRCYLENKSGEACDMMEDGCSSFIGKDRALKMKLLGLKLDRESLFEYKDYIRSTNKT